VNNAGDLPLFNPSAASFPPTTVADASDLLDIPGMPTRAGTHGDPTAESGEVLIDLQDFHASYDSSITYTAITLDKSDPPDLSDDTDFPAVTDDNTQYGSARECYIACSQVSSKRCYVLPL